MSKLLYVGGPQGVGKTFIILGLLELCQTQKSFAGFKAIQTGALALGAKEYQAESELFHHAISSNIHQTCFNPYQFHESLPPVFAGLRDGINPKLEVITKHLNRLQSEFDTVLIESSAALCSPLIENMTELQWLKTLETQIIWICGIGEHFLNMALMELHILQNEGLLPDVVILTNPTKTHDSNLIHYCWNTLQEKIECPVLAVIRSISSGLKNPQAVASLLSEQLSEDLKNYLF